MTSWLPPTHDRDGHPGRSGGRAGTMTPFTTHTTAARRARHGARTRSLLVARLGLLLVSLLFALTVGQARADAIATVLPTDGLRLRAGASIEHRVLELIPGGTRIAITSEATGDGWYAALYRGQRGWVLGAHLAFDDLTAAAARRATVTPPDGLNLRSDPTETASVLAVLTGGSPLTATGRATVDGWALVLVNEQTGWVKATFLAFDGQPAVNSPSPDALAVPLAAATPAVVGSFGAGAGPVTTRMGAAPVRLTYYHANFEGSRMYCGGVYRATDTSIAATNSWPCGTMLRVCRGAACVVVVVRDKGGMGPNWIDLSSSAFALLAPLPDSMVNGTVEVIAP